MLKNPPRDTILSKEDLLALNVDAADIIKILDIYGQDKGPGPGPVIPQEEDQDKRQSYIL